MHYIFTLGGKQSGYSRTGIGRRTWNWSAGWDWSQTGQGRNPTQLDFENLYRYHAPKDLVYPPANQPAGVVVYPYYTLKGPDDFFLNQ